MPIVIATAEVEDTTRWEEGFKTHTALFRKQSINSPIRFTSDESTNRITIQFDVENLEEYFKAMESEETAEAMAFDGVKRETVKVIVLDKSLEF